MGHLVKNILRCSLVSAIAFTSCTQPQQATYEPIHRFYQGGSLETKQGFYNQELSETDKQLLDNQWYHDQLEKFYDERQNRQFKDLRFRLIPIEVMPVQTENKSRIA